MQRVREFFIESVKDLNMFRIVFYAFLVFLSFSYVSGKTDAHYKNNNPWTVIESNAGFVRVQNEKGQKTVVRNPIPNVARGDIVYIDGFLAWQWLDLPYVSARVYNSSVPSDYDY